MPRTRSSSRSRFRHSRHRPPSWRHRLDPGCRFPGHRGRTLYRENPGLTRDWRTAFGPRALPGNPAGPVQGQAQLHATAGWRCSGKGSKASYATTVRTKGGAMGSIRNRSARAVTYGPRPEFRSACRHLSAKPASAIGGKRPPHPDQAQGETFWHLRSCRRTRPAASRRRRALSLLPPFRPVRHAWQSCRSHGGWHDRVQRSTHPRMDFRFGFAVVNGSRILPMVKSFQIWRKSLTRQTSQSPGEP